MDSANTPLVVDDQDVGSDAEKRPSVLGLLQEMMAEGGGAVRQSHASLKLRKGLSVSEEAVNDAVRVLLEQGVIRRETRKIDGVGVVVLVSGLSSVDEWPSSSRSCIDPGLLMPFRVPREPTGGEGAHAKPAVLSLLPCPKVAVFFSEMEQAFWKVFWKMWDGRTEGRTSQPAGSWNVGEIPTRCHLQNVESVMRKEVDESDLTDLRVWIRRCMAMGLLTKIGHYYAPGHNPLDVIVHPLPRDTRPVVVLSQGDAQALSRARACMEGLLDSKGVILSSVADRLWDELMETFESDAKIVSKLRPCFVKIGRGKILFPRLAVQGEGGNLVRVSPMFSTADVFLTDDPGDSRIVQPSDRDYLFYRDNALVQYESGVRRS